MIVRSEEFARAAENLLGTPYRLGGRCARHGVDCIGIVIVSLREIGENFPDLPTYGLRNRDFDFVKNIAGQCAVTEVNDSVLRGDIVMVRPGPAQRHLLINLGNQRWVHAHAGLRRVVIFTGELPWPVIQNWRLIKG